MIEFLKTQFLNNPMFTGLAGTALIGALLYQVRAIPARIVRFMEAQFVLTLTVRNDEPMFHSLNNWLSKRPEVQRIRRLAVGQFYNEETGRYTYRFMPGEGMHFFKFGGRPWLFSRAVAEQSTPGGGGPGGGGQRTETLRLHTIGRAQAVMGRLLDECQEKHEQSDVIGVYLHTAQGSEGIERTRRPLRTINIPDGQKHRLVTDIQTFWDKRAWYAETGIPWRRGVLLEGPPGTGKSSLIFALASHFKKSVHIVNPATLENDAALQQVMARTSGGFVVIEDIDSIPAALARSEGAPPVQSEAGKGITLSGILNAIDGVAAQEGRVLFITSNRADALDPALLRPGRIDMRERLDMACRDVALQMFRRLRPNDDETNFLRDILPDLPMSQAALQNRLLGMEDRVEPLMVIPMRGDIAEGAADLCIPSHTSSGIRLTEPARIGRGR